MKVSNPNNRYSIKVDKYAKVLEVGGGHNPHSRSNVIVDKYIDSNYHRKADIKILKGQKFIQADGEKLPFDDNEFDYVICNHVLEHSENPGKFLQEQMRVAKAGYIEVPSITGEYLFPKESHKQLIIELDNKLIIAEKAKFWSDGKMDFGFLFLTWLQQTSMSYKMLIKTRPDIMTVRYEWKDSIDFEVNPINKDYLKYFEGHWDKEMVTKLFPRKTVLEELKDTIKAFTSISGNGIYSVLRKVS